MTDQSRQQRRQLERERSKLGRTRLTGGLALHPRRDEMLAVAAVIKAKLEEAGNARRAGEAAGLVHGLTEASFKAVPPRAKIACTKGCAWCCYGFVGATAPEIFHLVAAVRAKGAATPPEAEIARRAAALRDIAPDDRVGARLPCALLKDNVCSVYASRPLVCRQATSLSLAACIEEYEGRDRDGRIEVSSVHLAHASNAHVALLGAMRATGLPTEAFELSSGLALALATTDAEARWLAGENVFAGLPRHVRRPVEVEYVASEIAREIAG